MRLRLRYEDFTNRRAAITLVDSPRPKCPTCKGTGWEQIDWPEAATGEYGGTEYLECECWDPEFFLRLIPVPRRLDRLRPGYTDYPF